MKNEKQVRTWWIELDPMCDGHSGDAWSERQTSTDIKVIAFEDHLAIVAELEGRIQKLRGALEDLMEQAEQYVVPYGSIRLMFAKEALKQDEE